MSNQKYRPGEKAPKTGEYKAYDCNGSCGGSVHLEQDQRFPATQNSGSYYTPEN